MAGTVEMPMFPLGSVLFPTMVLPLHVFEPRYRQLTVDCLAGEREFGVCLIERGWEVGGGDTRSTVGTVGQIVDAQEFDDGRWAMVAVGTRRFTVAEWLEDDPYPRASVEDWLDPEPTVDLSLERELALAEVKSLLASHAAELAGPPEEFPEIEADATLASYQLSTLAPLGPLDRQRLLAAADPGERLSLLIELVTQLRNDLGGGEAGR